VQREVAARILAPVQILHARIRREHRLKLREGNADQRLRAHGHRVGLVNDAELGATRARWDQVRGEIDRLTRARLAAALRRPEVSYQSLAASDPDRPTLPGQVTAEVENELKYQGYIPQS
jgi:tRNA uridine 5-carboxymethylaminomethyl modification enzyme